MSLSVGALAVNLVAIAGKAGGAIMEIYEAGGEARIKSDSSPVTEADEKAEALILQELRAAAPDLPVIAEESVAAGHVPEHEGIFALVDPLDGTKEFINRNGEFTVNIAIIEHGRPVLGVVYAPALSRVFVAPGSGMAFQGTLKPGETIASDLRPLAIRGCPVAGPVAVASRSHSDDATKALMEKYGVSEAVSAGSSLKFCLVAAGEADIYPRLGRTMEWDTAAGQAVAEAAGARVIEAETGQPLLYGKVARGYDNPGFIVLGDVTPL